MADGSQGVSQAEIARLAESIENGMTPDFGKKKGRRLTPRELESLKARLSSHLRKDGRADRVAAHRAAVRSARSLAHTPGLTQEEREGARPDHVQRLQAQKDAVRRAFAEQAQQQAAAARKVPVQPPAAPEGRAPRFPPAGPPDPPGAPAQG